MTLRSARRGGLRLVVFAPSEARVVKARLLRKGRVIARTIRAVPGDGVLTIVLPNSAKTRHRLTRGTYTVQVTPGARPGRYGATTSRTVRIR